MIDRAKELDSFAEVPQPEPIEVNNIPQELRSLPQWVLWKTKAKGNGKPTKIPYSAKGAAASVDNPQTWSTFEAVHQRYQRGGYSGVGFVFTADDPFCGIDLDGARNPVTGEFAEWAKRILTNVNTYAEVSPSGTGVKLFARAKWPMRTGKKEAIKHAARIVPDKEPAIEVYDHLRYFAVTGQRLETLSPNLESCSDQVADLVCYFKKPSTPREAKRHTAPATSDKAHILRRAEKYVDKMEPAIEGQGGHNATFAVACALILGFNLSVDEAWPIMEKFNSRCVGPWSEHELRHKLESADSKTDERGYLLNAERKESTNGYHETNGHANEASFADSEPDFGEGTADEPTAEEIAELDAVHQQENEAAQVDDLPRIHAGDQDLPRVTSQSWSAIQHANNPPTLFRYAGRPARIERGDDGEPLIRVVEEDRMRHHLARVAKWWKTKKSGEEEVEVDALPPKDVVKDVLASPDQKLPILQRIAEAPTFAPDGTLQVEPGYHPASKVYFAPAPGFVVPKISDRPSAAEVARARALICDDVLGDFPFISESEMAHSAALFLLPFVREMIPGSTPLHLFEKPTPGTGATLLVDMLIWPALGRPIPAMTEGRDEDEWRKRITSKLRSGSPILLIDNIKRKLDSAAVSSAITSPTWEDRVLGASEMVKIPVRCAWIGTGNNPLVSTEVSRRTIRIRLDAKMDQPWLREEKQFRHPDLREWVMAHRSDLVWAALTLIRAWIVAGRPQGSKTLGMFEAWSRTMGGILTTAQIPGFLGNLQAFYAESDFEGGAWRAFVGAWWDRYQTKAVGVADLFGMIGDEVALPLGDGNERSQKIKLGKIVADNRDRVFTIQDGEERLQVRLTRAGTVNRASLWKLAKGNGNECMNEMNEIPPTYYAGAPAHTHTRTCDLAENIPDIHDIHNDDEMEFPNFD